jgi:hypothetical protein
MHLRCGTWLWLFRDSSDGRLATRQDGRLNWPRVGLARAWVSSIGGVGKPSSSAGRSVCWQNRFSITRARTEVPGRHVTRQQMRLFMKFRHNHLQRITAANAGFNERTARRIETHRHLAPQPGAIRTRQGPDPFDGLWDSEIRPMLEAHPGLRPVALLEEMQRRHPDHDWDRLRRSLERRVRAWRAEHGADREVIFPQDHVPGQQALSTWPMPASALLATRWTIGCIISCWLTRPGSNAEPVLGGESFTALGVGLQNALFSLGGVPLEHRSDSLSAAFRNLYDGARVDQTRRYEALCAHYDMTPTRNKSVVRSDGSGRNAALRRPIRLAIQLR